MSDDVQGRGDARRPDRVRLTGVTATGYHGVFPHERREGQLFVADVVAHLDTRRAAATDDLAHTLDYGTLAEQVVSVLRGEPADLIETVAERIAATVLAYPQVQAVDVAVHKPQAPITVPFQDVVVEVHRDRSWLPAAEPLRADARPWEPPATSADAGLPVAGPAGAGASVGGVGGTGVAAVPTAAGALGAAATGVGGTGAVVSGPVPLGVRPAGVAPTGVLPAVPPPHGADVPGAAEVDGRSPGPSVPDATDDVPAAGGRADGLDPGASPVGDGGVDGPAAGGAGGSGAAGTPLHDGLPALDGHEQGGVTGGGASPASVAGVPAPGGPGLAIGEDPAVLALVGLTGGLPGAGAPVTPARGTGPAPSADDDVVEGELVQDALDREPDAPVEVVLAIGSNLGAAQDTLRDAVADLADVPGLEVVDVSALARTAPVGGVEQPDFLNAVVIGRTTLSPRDLLRATALIEQRHGRERTVHWGPRTLDVDIIVYGTVSAVTDDLELPHPRAHERAFVLQPWAQVRPDAVLHGLGGGPVAALAATAPDRDGVRWLALDWLTAPAPTPHPEGEADPAPTGGDVRGAGGGAVVPTVGGAVTGTPSDAWPSAGAWEPPPAAWEPEAPAPGLDVPGSDAPGLDVPGLLPDDLDDAPPAAFHPDGPREP